MNVGMTTAMATIQGLIAGRPTAFGESAALLIMPAPFPRWRFGLAWSSPHKPEAPTRKLLWSGCRFRWTLGCRYHWTLWGRCRWTLRERIKRLQDVSRVRSRRRFLVVDVGDDRQTDKQ